MPNISVKNLRGEIVVISYEDDGTLTSADLKRLIAKSPHMPSPEEQRLAWRLSTKRQVVLDDEKTLHEQNFKWGGAFDVIYHPRHNGAPGGPNFRTPQLTVNDLTGKRVTIEYPNGEISVGDLKERIAQKPDMPPADQQRLFWANKLLEDHHTLNEINFPVGEGGQVLLRQYNPAAHRDGSLDTVSLPEHKEREANLLAQQGLFANNEQNVEKQMGCAIVGLLFAIETKCKELGGLDSQAHFSFTATVVSALSKDQDGVAFGRLLNKPAENSIRPELTKTIEHYVKNHAPLRQLGDHSEFASQIKKQLIQCQQEALIEKFGQPDPQEAPKKDACVMM